jgi:hypothetical protein
LLLSSSNYYTIVNEGYSLLEREFYTLPIDIRKLLQKHIESSDHTTKIMEYQRLNFNHVMLIKGSVFVDNLMHEEEIPSFLHLIFIFKINNVSLLIVEQLQTIAFNESLWSYELEHTHLFFVKEPNDLIHIQPKRVDIYEIGKKSYANIFSRLTLEKNALLITI